MEITNKHGLPEPIYNAVKGVYPQKEGRLSVTRLIDSPLIPKLLKEHWDELSEDASDRLWALLGTALDGVLTEHAPKHWIVQEKLEIPVNGITVVGKIDYFDPETGVLGDWKATSAWSYVLGGREEWEKQLNVYDWMERWRGRTVKALVAQRLFRDFMARKSNDPDYPDIPFMTIELPRWTPDQQEAYIFERIKCHTEDASPRCAAEERWEKPTTWAVMKKGRKSALRVLSELAEAKTWCVNNGHGTWDKDAQGLIKLAAGIEIVKRVGECVRCKSYCPVRYVCPNNPEKDKLE
jgi:hypothetical protein